MRLSEAAKRQIEAIALHAGEVEQAKMLEALIWEAYNKPHGDWQRTYNAWLDRENNPGLNDPGKTLSEALSDLGWEVKKARQAIVESLPQWIQRVILRQRKDVDRL